MTRGNPRTMVVRGHGWLMGNSTWWHVRIHAASSEPPTSRVLLLLPVKWRTRNAASHGRKVQKPHHQGLRRLLVHSSFHHPTWVGRYPAPSIHPVSRAADRPRFFMNAAAYNAHVNGSHLTLRSKGPSITCSAVALMDHEARRLAMAVGVAEPYFIFMTCNN